MKRVFWFFRLNLVLKSGPSNIICKFLPETFYNIHHIHTYDTPTCTRVCSPLTTLSYFPNLDMTSFIPKVLLQHLSELVTLDILKTCFVLPFLHNRIWFRRRSQNLNIQICSTDSIRVFSLTGNSRQRIKPTYKDLLEHSCWVDFTCIVKSL